MQQDTGFLKLQWKDIAKGFLIAFGTVLFPTLYNIIFTADHFPTWLEFRPYLAAATSAGVSYVVKNYFTNNQGEIGKKDAPVKMVPANSIVLPPELKPE